MRGSCAVHARDTKTAMCQEALNTSGSWLSILQAPWYPLVSIAIHNIHWCCQISMNIQNVPDGNWSGDFLRTSSVWALGPNHINYCKQARPRQQDQASEHAKRQSQISNASILSCWAHRYQLPPTLEMYGISWNRMQRCTAFPIFMNLQGFSISRSMFSLFFPHQIRISQRKRATVHKIFFNVHARCEFWEVDRRRLWYCRTKQNQHDRQLRADTFYFHARLERCFKKQLAAN